MWRGRKSTGPPAALWILIMMLPLVSGVSLKSHFLCRPESGVAGYSNQSGSLMRKKPDPRRLPYWKGVEDETLKVE